MKYPKGETYEALYLRYLDKAKMEEFIQMGGPLHGANIVDLCGGTGRLSAFICEHNPTARCLLVDASADMSLEVPQRYPVSLEVMDAQSFLQYTADKFSHVFCQQAINYWFTPELMKDVYRILKPQGVFIFNTFSKCPPLTPMTKRYVLEEEGKASEFLEISWKDANEDLVHHVQIREGYPPHTTAFKWVPPEVFSKSLENAGFLVQLVSRGSSLTFKAVKPI